MKKITLLLLMLSSAAIAQQQVEKFELKKDGFPDFVVVEFPGKTSSEIFTQVKKWAEYNIRNTDYSNYSEIENEYLTYTINYIDAFEARNTMGKVTFDVRMDVELRIKDGKLRIDLRPKRIGTKDGMVLPVSGGMGGILKKDGSQRKYNLYKDAFHGMNNLANRVVTDFAQAVNGKTDYKNSEW